MTVKGVHTYYNTSARFKMPDYEVVVMVLSALYYRKYIGPVVFCCNHTVKNYLVENNLDQYWDEINTDISTHFDKIKNYRAPFMFGAFKNYTIQHIKGPFIIMDHDFMFKSAIPSELLECDVRFLHLEQKDLETYLPHADPDYQWGHTEFDNWDVFAIPNLGATYYNNEKFAYRYSSKITGYYRGIPGRDGRTKYRQSFDQQFLMMMLEKEELEVNTFSNLILNPNTREFTKQFPVDPLKEKVKWYHLWVNKHFLRFGHSASFYDRMKQEIVTQFPNEFSNLKYLFP